MFRKLVVNSQSRNINFKSIAAGIFSILIILGVIDTLLINEYSSHQIIISVLLLAGIFVLYFNLIESNIIKISIMLLEFLYVVIHIINILQRNYNYENYGSLYVTVMFILYIIIGLMFLSIRKIMKFVENEKSKYYESIALASLNDLKSISFLLFVFFFALGINWFSISIIYHSMIVFLLSLIPLLCFFNIKLSKEANDLTYDKALVLYIPWLILSFTVDYMIWRRFVSEHLSPNDNTLGIVNSFSLSNILFIQKILFLVVSFVLIIFILKRISRLFMLNKLEDALKSKKFRKDKRIMVYPDYYLRLSFTFLAFYIIPLIYYFGYYSTFYLFFLVYYYRHYPKNEIVLDYSEEKELNYKRISDIYSKINLDLLKYSMSPILVIAFILAIMRGFEYGYYLVMMS